MSTYKVVRFYQGDHPREVVETGLTLEEAQAHCKDPDSSSRTCTSKSGNARTRKFGDWFEGFEEE